jgi:RHS repeat-associated protein
VAELDGAGNLVSTFVYGAKTNVPEYVVRGGATYRIVSDHLGSPRRAINVANSSDVPFSAAYTSFGEVSGTGLEWMPFSFAGGGLDLETGLVRFGARDYDAFVGRWTAKDPIRFRSEDGANLYQYVASDPINRADPTGLDSKCKQNCGAGFGVGGLTCIAACTQLKHPAAIGACLVVCLGAVYGATEYCKSKCDEEEDEDERSSCN